MDIILTTMAAIFLGVVLNFVAALASLLIFSLFHHYSLRNQKDRK